MRAVIQRVSKASVEIDKKLIGEIGNGFVVLLGITLDDDWKDAEYLAAKTANLRVFEDDLGKMNVSLLEKMGEVLAISQFTLYSDTRKGRRPSFIKAAPPEKAEPLYDSYIIYLQPGWNQYRHGVLWRYVTFLAPGLRRVCRIMIEEHFPIPKYFLMRLFYP